MNSKFFLFLLNFSTNDLLPIEHIFGEKKFFYEKTVAIIALFDRMAKYLSDEDLNHIRIVWLGKTFFIFVNRDKNVCHNLNVVGRCISTILEMAELQGQIFNIILNYEEFSSRNPQLEQDIIMTLLSSWKRRKDFDILVFGRNIYFLCTHSMKNIQQQIQVLFPHYRLIS